MFDSVIRSVVAEEYHTVFIIVQADLGHLFALTNGGGSTSPGVVTSLEIYVYIFVRKMAPLDATAPYNTNVSERISVWSV